ncbi:MAG: hypothetical protein WD267_06150 [Balneolales bacterium]
MSPLKSYYLFHGTIIAANELDKENSNIADYIPIVQLNEQNGILLGYPPKQHQLKLLFGYFRAYISWDVVYALYKYYLSRTLVDELVIHYLRMLYKDIVLLYRQMNFAYIETYEPLKEQE